MMYAAALAFAISLPALAASTSPIPPERPALDAAPLLATDPTPTGEVPLPAPAERAPEAEAPDMLAMVAPEPAAEPGPAAADGPAPVTAPLPPVYEGERPHPVREAIPDLRPRGDVEEEPEVLAIMAVPEIVPGIPSPGAPLPPAGAFCRDPRLVGTVAPTFVATTAGCGILEPVEISAAAGVTFTTEAKIDCITARAVADWLMGVVQPAAKERFGTSVTKVRVVGSYVCRTRNHQRGARISEHGKGRAIDIAGFTLADGRQIEVQSGWRKSGESAFLKRVWKGACGVFGTVLGPDSDRFHHDHFHLDTARYRSGSYCR